MKSRIVFFASLTGALLLSFALVATVVLPAFAGPGYQDEQNLPTPTPQPILDVSYQLTTVGGTPETLTFPGAELEGIVIGETSATSAYPRGVQFSVPISTTDSTVEIVSVTLFIRFAHGSGERVFAELDADTQAWTAHPWQDGNGQPAWTHFSFYWSVTDSNGNTVEGPAAKMDYSDPNREWFRVETPHIIIYWFGFGEERAAEIAEGIASAMAATHERRVIGFGGDLSYKPIGVVYPSNDDLSEIYGSGLSNTNAAGFTSDALGMTVQDIGIPTDEWFEYLKDCVWLTPREDRTEEWRTNNTIFGTIPHEVTHLFQYEHGVLRGPEWWTEGQAEWFSQAPGQYDRRLRYLSALQEIPTLDGQNIGSDGLEADGCYALSYDVGPSFINWLLTSYGGLETHARIIDVMKGNVGPIEAIEEVTGKSFFELENEWRVYLGFNILSLADVDPAAALEAPIDPLFEAGDMATVPGPRPLPLAEAPGPNQLANAQCFAGSTVEILQVGSLDGVNYYKVNCLGLEGWVLGNQLSQ